MARLPYPLLVCSLVLGLAPAGAAQEASQTHVPRWDARGVDAPVERRFFACVCVSNAVA